MINDLILFAMGAITGLAVAFVYIRSVAKQRDEARTDAYVMSMYVGAAMKRFEEHDIDPNLEDEFHVLGDIDAFAEAGWFHDGATKREIEERLSDEE